MVGCAICLADEFSDAAFVDGCFHCFCYPCILLWSQSLLASSCSGDYLRCPMCNAGYDSLIHGITDAHFSRHCLLHPHLSTDHLSLTKAQLWRRSCYSQAFQADTASFSGSDCTRYLWDWMVRDLQALMLDKDVTLVAHLVKGALQGLHKASRSKNLSDMARSAAAAAECHRILTPVLEPFLFQNSARFVKEVLNYLASGLTIDAYDRQLQGYRNEENDTCLLFWSDDDVQE